MSIAFVMKARRVSKTTTQSFSFGASPVALHHINDAVSDKPSFHCQIRFAMQFPKSFADANAFVYTSYPSTRAIRIKDVDADADYCV